MIFWNLYKDYRPTEHSIEFVDLKQVNPNHILQIEEIKNSGLIYLRFMINDNLTDAYYYPGPIEDFNKAIYQYARYYALPEGLIECVPELGESTFMFTSEKREIFNNSDDPLTFTIKLEDLIKNMDKQWNDICGDNNEKTPTD